MKRRNLWPALFLTAMLLVFLPMTVQAASKKITVDPGEDGSEAGYVIRRALQTAKKKATKKKPYVITVAPGSYTLSCELFIYPYTTLVMTGVTLTRTNEDYNMLRVGDQYDISGDKGDTGYCYQKIKVVGGTWDGAGYSATVLKFAHAKNITLDGVTVQNSRDGHLIEVAATDGFTCKNCTFRDMIVPPGEKTICYEAVQLDVLVPGHFNGYRAEALPVIHASFTNCSFTNVPRGIGSHTSFLNAPHSNISVKKCTFDNIGSCAMQFQYCTKITLSNNTITDSPRGIAVYGVMPEGGTGIFKASVLKDVNGLEQTLGTGFQEGLLKDITISGNSITLTGKKDPLAGYDPLGIIVSGGIVTNDSVRKDGSGGIPGGDYYISNAVVKNNTITDHSGKAYSIRFFNVRNSKILKNRITGKLNKTINIYAINVKNGCKGIAIDKNTITNSDGNSIYVTDCQVDSISGNTITGTGKYGISLERTDAEKISRNTVSKTGNISIMVMNRSTVGSITGNKISDTPKYGICLAKNSRAGTVTGNKITRFRGARAINCDNTSKIAKKQ